MAAAPITFDQAEREIWFGAMQPIMQSLISHRTPTWRRNDPSSVPLMWHYTTGENLIRILRSGQIWTTQVACLNDRSEVELAGDRFRDAIAKLSSEIPEDDAARTFVDVASKKQVDDEAATSPWFVGCFSERENDLSQWRAYGGGEGGYALGFNLLELNHYAMNQGARLYPVIYNKAEQERIAEEVAKVVIHFFRDGLRRRSGVTPAEFLIPFTQAFSLMTGELAPLAKDDSFKDEEEWRLIWELRTDAVPRLEFSQRHHMIKRHLPLNLHNAQSRTDVPRPQPGEKPSAGAVMPALRKIIVGPSPFKERSRISVGDLLGSVGYPPSYVNVSVSNIPYQSP